MSEAVARRCSVTKCVLGNFVKIIGKHLCLSLFFNKVAGLSLQILQNFYEQLFLANTSGGCFLRVTNVSHFTYSPLKCIFKANPANIYLLKVNNRNTRKKYEICSKLIWPTFLFVIANFKHTSHLFLMFPLLTLNRKHVCEEL